MAQDFWKKLEAFLGKTLVYYRVAIDESGAAGLDFEKNNEDGKPTLVIYVKNDAQAAKVREFIEKYKIV